MPETPLDHAMSRPSSSAERGEPRFTNRLAGETSPYLLQHAHNPVDWYPWGPEALEAARRLDKPIFLSIGYAACHWCHVMEHESFEDEATARQLNANFVPIKVDREERPDLDQVYMAAVQAMTGQGGWPMSVFLTPDGKPFYGGTYFPNEPRHGMPSFGQVLDGVSRAWVEQRTEVEASGGQLVAALVEQSRGVTTGGVGAGPTVATLEAAVGALDASFDRVNGGWGRAPKFPQAMTIEFLLRRFRTTGDARAIALARSSLDKMADGGIHDQLSGGFHRYSTDARWLVPHFEKMLYDNAQLARVYVHAYQLTGERRYLSVAQDTLDYVAREMVTGDGGFAASQDADTEGEEGKTFVWTTDEIVETLAEAAAVDRSLHPEPRVPPGLTELTIEAYGVSAEGNWEGKTILSRVRSDEELARSFELSSTELGRRLQLARSLLLVRRNERTQPGRDDKVLTSWNGLMLGAFGDAIRVFGRDADPAVAARAEVYRGVALRAAETILHRLLSPAGRLSRSWKDGRASQNGVLEDYAHLAEGLLSMYEATFDERYFDFARMLVEVVLEHFADPGGGFFDTSDDHEHLVTRPKDVQDNAIPSGSAMAAIVLLKLAALTGDGRYRDAAERAMSLVAGLVARYPTSFGQWLVAMDFALSSVVEIAIVGDPEDARTRALLEPALAGFRPHQVLASAREPKSSRIELLQARFALDGKPTAFVCQRFACRQPVTEAAALAAQLSGE